MQYLADEFFPVYAPNYLRVVWTGKIHSSVWLELVKEYKTKSLRQIARDYGVSHETVRRTLKAVC